MELFHTSPTLISSINSMGRFGEFLFFSSKPYSMTAGEYVTYTIELDDNDAINAGQLFYHEDAEKLDALVAKFADRFSVDIDTAEDIISERRQLETGDSDDRWDVQLYTATAAKLLGFRAVRVTDEQGGAYMINMRGRESDLEMINA